MKQSRQTNQNKWREIMLYSEVLKGEEMESTEIPIETAQGISLAFGYDLHLIPGAPIKPDGNCVIELVMDQMQRYVYYTNDFTHKILDTFPSIDRALRTLSVAIHRRTELRLRKNQNLLCVVQ